RAAGRPHGQRTPRRPTNPTPQRPLRRHAPAPMEISPERARPRRGRSPRAGGVPPARRPERKHTNDSRTPRFLAWAERNDEPEGEPAMTTTSAGASTASYQELAGA